MLVWISAYINLTKGVGFCLKGKDGAHELKKNQMQTKTLE